MIVVNLLLYDFLKARLIFLTLCVRLHELKKHLMDIYFVKNSFTSELVFISF